LQEGHIKIDSSKDRMEMDLERPVGRDRGRTALAIYSWPGADLKLCAVERFGGNRPMDFTTKEGDDRVLIVFRRQNP
jgi:uncharacterized protein (TIGR03067 family)